MPGQTIVTRTIQKEALKSASSRAPGSVQLYRQCYRLAAAQAERSQTAPPAPCLQGVQQCNKHPCAAGPDRMPQRDRAAVNINAIPVKPKLATICDHLGCKCLIDLE